jgi:threonine dehydratase
MGAFKFRGAWNLISQIPEERRRAGVVAFSSGNHAQAVALAARELGVSAVIVMPDDAPALKLAATRGYGAAVRLYDRAGESRELSGKANLALRKGDRVVMETSGGGGYGKPLSSRAG